VEGQVSRLQLLYKKNNGVIRDYTVIRWKPFADSIQKINLTPTSFLWILFGLASILAFGTTLVSFLIFRIRTDDWLVILIALSQLFLSSTLNEVVALVQTGGQLFGVLVPAFIGVIIGPALLLTTIYLFPDGKPIPSWIKWFIPIFFLARPIVYNEYTYLSLLSRLPSISSLIWIVSLIGGITVQIHKYKTVSSIVKKQQIKWAMIGFFGMAATLILSDLLDRLSPAWWVGDKNTVIWESIFLSFRNFILLSVPLLISSIAMIIAVYRYKLWDADFYINRAIIYGTVTGILAIIWTITIALLQYFFLEVTNQQSPLVAAVLSSIQVAALFNPVRKRVENWVNQRFYKDRINFVEAIVELQAEKWQYVSTKDMFQLLATKIPQLIKSTKSAIYIYDKKGLSLVSAFGIEKKEAQSLRIEPKGLEQLKKGKIVKLPVESSFVLLVPLSIPRGHEIDLAGILALGPRKDDRGYSRDHISDLKDLGRSAGLAIHFLRLNENKKIVPK
jgi:hypothetical protein